MLDLKFLIICFLSGLVSGSTFATEPTGPLRSFLKDFKTLQADFTQTLLNEHGERLEQTSGTLYLQRPGKFHWSYRKPYLQTIISDGEVLWVYDEDLEQVTIKHITAETLNQTPAGIILGDAELEKHFVQVDMGDIEGFDWIELTPRDLEAQYQNIRIGFDANNLGMMIITDSLGQTTRIDFSNINKNSGLTANLFNLDIPDFVDIIDERPGAETATTE